MIEPISRISAGVILSLSHLGCTTESLFEGLGCVQPL